MSSTQSELFRSNKVAVLTALVAIAIFICCSLITGFHYEMKKFKCFLATICLALIYQIFFGDVILMVLKATFNAIYLRHPWSQDVNPLFVGGPNRREYLKRRIAALKKQLQLGPTFYKRNEAMTRKYKEVLNDLLLFGGYLIILLVLITATRDSLMFYHTRTLKQVLKNPVFSDTTIDQVLTSEDLYNFINGTIIDGLTNGTSYNGKPFKEGGWTKWQIAKLLGVVRMRQIRLQSHKKRTVYDPGVYGPLWSKELASLPYKGKFWRIFQPWEYQSSQQTEDIDNDGKIYHQPGGGYVTLLGRNTRNSHRVLDFLRANDWIDSLTAVIIIDFTLYNVDTDVFTLVKITAEQTAFKSFVTTVKVSALKLLFNIDNLPWHATLASLLYFLIFTKVVAYVVLRVWFSPSLQHFLSSFWNHVDVVIVILNLGILVGLWVRESIVKKLLLQLETSRKNEYIPFSKAAFIDETCTVMIAFLVAITTIRLWKVLQFARVFRVLTRTLSHAKGSLTSTTFFIFIFIMGMGLGSIIINGSNSPKFLGMMTCISSLMSLSFGFTTDVSPSDLNYGGSTLGFILYAVLVIAVSIFLVNMFITVLCLQFAKEREEENNAAKSEDSYTFWHFLSMEISELFLGSFASQKKCEEEEKDEDILRLRGGGNRFGKPKQKIPGVRGPDEDIDRLELISEILETQIALLSDLVGDEGDDEDCEQPRFSGVTVIDNPEEEHHDGRNTSKNSQQLHRKWKRSLIEETLTTSSRAVRSP